jgi:hypothetical protein
MITRSIVSNNEEHLREKFRWPFIFCDCPTQEALPVNFPHPDFSLVSPNSHSRDAR